MWEDLWKDIETRNTRVTGIYIVLNLRGSRWSGDCGGQVTGPIIYDDDDCDGDVLLVLEPHPIVLGFY